MKKIALLIPTYNRPEMLLDLLGDIHSQHKGYEIFLLIVNDHSSLDYSRVKLYLEKNFPKQYYYQVNPENYGKKYYWRNMNAAYKKLQATRFDFFIQLADDLRLVDGFFKKAMQSWLAITDKKAVCLNLNVEFSRLMKPFWTSLKPYHVSFGRNEFVRTGWTDLCLISSRAFLQALNYTVNPVDSRWSAKEGVSSGVGMQISRRLINSGHSIYSLKRSLVIADDHPSVMHPDHRQENKLLTNHNMDKITATMATMPGREESVRDVIKSIIDQVDELRIYANNMHQAPFNLHHRKLKWLFSGEHAGDLGDAGKFYGTGDIKGYHFTIDDDIIYPKDYVAEMIAAVERYQRRCVVSIHGRTFPPGGIKSYYRGAVGRYSCLRSVTQDVFAHVVGTGVLAYHTDTIRIPFDIFKAANMADVWFSVYCQRKKVPRLIMKHAGGWVKDSGNYDQGTCIYASNCNDDILQTKVMNSVSWNLP